MRPESIVDSIDDKGVEFDDVLDLTAPVPVHVDRHFGLEVRIGFASGLGAAVGDSAVPAAVRDHHPNNPTDLRHRRAFRRREGCGGLLLLRQFRGSAVDILRELVPGTSGRGRAERGERQFVPGGVESVLLGVRKGRTARDGRRRRRWRRGGATTTETEARGRPKPNEAPPPRPPRRDRLPPPPVPPPPPRLLQGHPRRRPRLPVHEGRPRAAQLPPRDRDESPLEAQD
mmetsp:Transcript_7320/g.15509  ORF Transcript_7320/g.15509 Transcript_7320/m.15509 type:complete len:229 (+) Transcript_7320:165-851(+)